MTARDAESAMLLRCCVVARGGAHLAQDQREANVFRLASMVIGSRFATESECLLQASERYFASHPHERLPADEVVRVGWVSSLPRLRDRLIRRLSHLSPEDDAG